MATNAQILSAIINKWAQPFLQSFMTGKVQSLGFLSNLESKIKSTGWVSPRWSIMQDLSPLMESLSGSLVTPMLNRYLSQLDDAAIPQMAHNIVDDALKRGSLSLFEDKVEIERADLEYLKKLLDYNLPYNESDVITIKE